MQCARATRHEHPAPLPLPGPKARLGHTTPEGFVCSRGRRTARVPRGALSRYKRGPQTSAEIPEPSSLDLCRTLPAGGRSAPAGVDEWDWSPLRGCYNRPRGGAAGIRTPDLRRARAALSRLSYGPSRPLPLPGGRAWTRTRDLGLIRAALSPPELR